MSARASLRSQLLIGSVLWTFGVLLVISVLMIAFLAHNPRPHAVVLGWMMTVPTALSCIIGVTCMAAGVWRIRRSLSAVDQIQVQLSMVHRGEGSHVTGRYPVEVQPLVDDLNALLAEREERVRRAVAKAGDLAHGLKTPLAVLHRDAQRATSTDPSLADSLQVQVDRMRRYIDYHLAHARAAAGSSTAGVKSAVAPSVDALLRTLRRLHADSAITLSMSVPDAHAVRCQRQDLEELLGNLLDNACKWGRTRVHVESAAAAQWVTILVDDDGPGLEASMEDKVMQRGVRADERVPGSGLGLAIVRDLVELYGGSVELTASPLGGLRACLRLPSPDALLASRD